MRDRAKEIEHDPRIVFPPQSFRVTKRIGNRPQSCVPKRNRIDRLGNCFFFSLFSLWLAVLFPPLPFRILSGQSKKKRPSENEINAQTVYAVLLQCRAGCVCKKGVVGFLLVPSRSCEEMARKWGDIPALFRFYRCALLSLAPFFTTS